MAEVEVNLPDRLYSEIERLAESEFLNREEAIDELLTAGIRAYQDSANAGEEEDTMGEEMWNIEETDPGAMTEEDSRDDYTF
ncbi:MAG: CopG family transcriptional regulator [Haloarculaceae archaeon]